MESDDEPVIRIGKIIESMDEETDLVMGGIDNKYICTFTKGYMKRQALYTCTTCLDVTKVKAGFCYPCAINCHDGHELIELYTKRNFRCDCGNAKFSGICECSLWEEKDDENILNSYNSNFSNLYCTCQRPYPDESYEGDEEMIQCGICEDWYHVGHLNMGTEFQVPEEYEEMTCFQCIKKYVFLFLHAWSHNNAFRSASLAAVINNISDTKADSIMVPASKQAKLDINDQQICQLVTSAKIFNCQNSFRNLKLDEMDIVNYSNVPSVFWSSGWRELLCRCEFCQRMYKDLKLGFLVDPEDTMTYYLKLGKKRAEEIDQEEQHALKEALAELPHPVAVNVATGVSKLKRALEEFFMKDRDKDHVVTESEVKSFFENLRKNM